MYVTVYVTVKVFKGFDGVVGEKQNDLEVERMFWFSNTKTENRKRVTVHPLGAHVSPQCWGMWEWVVGKP